MIDTPYHFVRGSQTLIKGEVARRDGRDVTLFLEPSRQPRRACEATSIYRSVWMAGWRTTPPPTECRKRSR